MLSFSAASAQLHATQLSSAQLSKISTTCPHADPTTMTTSDSNAVNHPQHYTDRVPGIECIDITEHFDFNRGNAIKYLWRAGMKGDVAEEIQDLRKAAWYAIRAANKLAAQQT